MKNEKLSLIPGAWSDASIWELIVDELSNLGIESLSITLEGLDKEITKKHIDLETHIHNVTTYIEAQQNDQCYLVGHSYSGIVASLAAARFPDKIAGLIFVEAFLPENNKSLLEVAGLDVESEIKAIKQNNGLWPPPTMEELIHQPFLSESQKYYLINTMVGHPGKTITDKVQIDKDVLKNIPTYYIGGNLSERIKTNPNFGNITFNKLNGGHWPMLSKPKALASIINKLQLNS
ncbi:alpha/beta fold hydrolase [Pseudotamlana agarivorans]|uniref:alpha/beta fold hydrolase n=1 Tax=Pseudotamlana agarivorans TaxID=481183 RepID=UPI00082CB99A|nr:alpha/beta hydrolase [Tamlana agarivorans]